MRAFAAKAAAVLNEKGDSGAKDALAILSEGLRKYDANEA